MKNISQMEIGKGQNGGLGRVCGPDAQEVLAAYRKAQQSALNAVQDALVCGLLLREKREALTVCHRGTAGIVPRNSNGRFDGQFDTWLASECPEISRRTAYRWMELAERVSKAALQPAAPYHQPLDLGEGSLRLSQVLTLPEAELSEQAREWRQLLLDFTEQRTITECLEGVMLGDQPHGVTRAWAGMSKGGTNGHDDRKDFPWFVAKALGNITSHLDHALSNSQQAQVAHALDAAIARWPRWVVEELRTVVAREMRLNDEQRAVAASNAKVAMQAIAQRKTARH